MLLRTRFYIPPLRHNAVVRDHLLQRLHSTGGGSLVLVTAPAGYGKTTLVSQWLHHYPHTFAWLTLGPEHNVIAVFWQYVLTALQQILPAVGREAEAMTRVSDSPDYQQMLVALLNDLDQFSINNRADDPLTLVLDDFHLLYNRRLLVLINLFLDHLPPGVRVVITARRDPDLFLPRRRASGQLLQLGIDELRFDARESCEFFSATMGLSIVAELAPQLCMRTEGWIAGLQLAALSLQRNPADAASVLHQENLDRHIADYLLEEVLLALPDRLQQFLLSTSIVTRFCAGLCNAITDRDDSLSVLAGIESANLFLVPLDNHRTWFRYHDLFRQFLAQRFALTPAATGDRVLRQALGWLERQGYVEDAVELCLTHARWADAVRLLGEDDNWPPQSAAADKRAQWLRQVPPAVVAEYPALPLATGEVSDNDTGNSNEPGVDDDAALTLVEPLTRQEEIVLGLIGQGLPNKIIARDLQISINTLKVHIRNLYGKMGVENRVQALLRMRE